MLKIRLNGTEEEISKYLDRLHQDKKVRIISESDLYKDRDKGENSRLYIDLEMKESDENKSLRKSLGNYLNIILGTFGNRLKRS